MWTLNSDTHSEVRSRPHAYFFVKIFAICVADELGSALSVDPTDIEDSRDATVTFASSLPSIETLWSSKDKF